MTTLPTSLGAAPPPPLPTFAVAREVTVGLLVSRTFTVWKANPFKYAGVVAVSFVPLLAFGGAFAGFVAAAPRGVARSAARLPMPELLLLAIFPISAAMMVVMAGGLSHGALERLAGRRVGFGAMIRAALRRGWTLLALMVVAAPIILGGTILLIVPGIVLGCAVSAAVPAVMGEGIGAIDAIRRSWALTRGYRLRIFATFGALWLISVAANSLLQLGSAVLTAAGAGLIFIPMVILGLAMMLSFSSWWTLLPAVVYHELRTLKEGAAPEELVKVFE